jgi:hypothetical protein
MRWRPQERVTNHLISIKERSTFMLKLAVGYVRYVFSMLASLGFIGGTN